MQAQRMLSGRYATGTISLTDDVYIREGTPTTNNSASNALQVSRQASSDTRSALIQFPLSSLPATATVTKATLNLWTKDTDTAIDLIVYRLLTSFVLAQATWNEYATGSSWNTAGALGAGTDYNATVLITQAIPATLDQLMAVDITQIVRNWMDGTWPNHGLLFWGSDPGSSILRDFHSSRASTPSLRPALYLEYMK